MTLSEVKYEAKTALNGYWKKAIVTMIIYFLITFLASFILSFIHFIGPIINYIISIPLSVGLIFIFLRIAKKEDYNYLDFLMVAKNFFGRSWGLVFSTLLKMWKPLLLIVVSLIILAVNIVSMTNSSIFSATQPSASSSILSLLSIVLTIVSIIWILSKGLLYSLAYFILLDNPNMDNKSILEKSEYLMIGNRLKLILLPLSFIGWVLLIYAILLLVPSFLSKIIGIWGGIIIAYIILLISTSLLNIYMQVSHACFYKRLLSEK